MTSGKLTKKPSDLARERLNSRARKIMIESGVTGLGRLTDSQKMTPSERKSLAGKRREKKRAGNPVETPTMYDCRDCISSSMCVYGGNLNECNLPSLTHRCKQCGQKVMYRRIENDPWELCPVCREKQECRR